MTNINSQVQRLVAKAASPAGRQISSPLLRLSALAVSLSLAGAAQAVDFGPFSLTGFAKAEFVHGNNHCFDCQWVPGENKDRYWADAITPGAKSETSGTKVVLFQPYLGAKFDLGRGYQLSGLLSQRWRDGKEDIPGFWYEKNVAISHEDYGRLAYGAMTTRSWSLADYPYGSNIGISDIWASSGAGYGMMTAALRYTSRPFDVMNGDLVLEATYDRGETDFKINKPKFVELYAKYYNGDIVLDAVYQDTRNGGPQSWGHGPFTGLTPFPADDAKLGGSGQSIAMLMARYQVNAKYEVYGGVRHNRWSGAYAVITQPASAATTVGLKDIWNSMFNVDWSNDIGGLGVYRGYPATSTDFSGGVRYKNGPWSGYVGMTYLGKASTDNPSERGQSNTALLGTVGAEYAYGHGLAFYALANALRYGRLGLSPLSMPGNSSFTNVDSRVNRDGNWVGVGAVHTF